MKQIKDLLLQLAQPEQSTLAEGDMTALSEAYFTEVTNQPWFYEKDRDWWKDVCRESASRIVGSLKSRVSKGVSMEQVTKEVAVAAQSGIEQVFFVPAVIERMYSPKPVEDGWINQGVSVHCRFIQKAVRSVSFRNQASIQHLSMDLESVTEELWGLVMEEVVRCMTDVSARVWELDNVDSVPELFPPQGMRGSRLGVITQVALLKKDNLLAAYRSDHLLTLWDIVKKERIQNWDLSGAFADEKPEPDIHPVDIAVSNDGKKIAVELSNQHIALVQVDQDEEEIQFFYKNDKDLFLKQFGSLRDSQTEYLPETRSKVQLENGERVQPEEYIRRVFGWDYLEPKERLATASEKDRRVPDWIKKAGFERAVYHIAKKRLIDLIRKHSHTSYACWRCGSMSSGLSDGECRSCNADFTSCPVCKNNSEPLGTGNRWTCPTCEFSTREYRQKQEIDPDILTRMSVLPASEWKEEFDFQRILEVMKEVKVTYKKTPVRCDRLMELKAKGLTNEAIGEELNVPRGSVDYLWNQCKKQFLQIFGTI